MNGSVAECMINYVGGWVSKYCSTGGNIFPNPKG